MIPLPAAPAPCGADPLRDIREDASRWVVRLSDTECDSATHAAFEAWYAASPQHAAAFDRLSRIWGTLGRVQPESLRPRRRLGRAIANGLLALVVLGGALGGAAYDAPDYRAQARIERVVLPDGSLAVLDAGSAIRLDFAQGRRTVTLLRGRAFFEVRPRGAGMAPFAVRTGQGTATALGTRFDVALPPEGMRVTVYEHEVAVLCTVCEPAQALTLAPGERAQLRQGKWQREAGTPGAAPSWSQGLLRFDDITLAEAVARLQPYSARHILLTNDALAGIRVSGTVNTADPRRALAFLLGSQPGAFHELPGLLWLR